VAVTFPVLVMVAPPLGELEFTVMEPPFVTVTPPDAVTSRVLLSVGSRMRIPELEGA
jgi:hypothetical protein